MRPRPSVFLTILLLLAAASPPPRMAATLADAGTHREADGGRVPQARGRNRVPSPPGPDLARVEGRLGSGADGRRVRPTASPGRRTDPGHDAHPLRPITSPHAHRASVIRLRC